jgi:heterogeneous nuclear rnp K-like protein 2
MIFFGGVFSLADQDFSAQAPHDQTGERMFTIMGSAKANESALLLLYENLEAEKLRRSQNQSPE